MSLFKFTLLSFIVGAIVFVIFFILVVSLGGCSAYKVTHKVEVHGVKHHLEVIREKN